MSTHKHIDIICVIIVALTLIITFLFMNGESFGIVPIIKDESENGMFTDNDCDGSWDKSEATKITLTNDNAEIEGTENAYFYDGDLYIGSAGKYVVSGTLTDGSIIVNAEKNNKVWILLDGVNIHCNDSAAVYVKKADKVFLTLADGKENVLSDGENYSDESVAEKIDGVIFSKEDLTINGTGALTVNAGYHHGIVCNDDFVITGGNIKINALQDGIHAHDSVRIKEASVEIAAEDDGIHANNDDENAFMYIESGKINITKCYEGLESIKVTIAGGDIQIKSEDDGINACGSGKDSLIDISGGNILLDNPTGKDADGLDSNKDIIISGGKTIISVNGNGGTNNAIDYGSENGGKCQINGGTVVACGSNGMVEAIDSASEQGFYMCDQSGTENATVMVKDVTGQILVNETIPNGFNCLILSAPNMKIGETYTLQIAQIFEKFTVDNSSLSGGMGGMQQNQNAEGLEPQKNEKTQDNMTKPEDMTMPMGMEKPEDMPEDMTMPEGMEKPDEMPENMTPPDNEEDFQKMPPDMPENNDGTQQPQKPDDNFGETEGQVFDETGKNSGKNHSGMNRNGVNVLTEENCVMIVLVTVSMIILSIGLIIATRFKDRI